MKCEYYTHLIKRCTLMEVEGIRAAS